MKKLFPFFLVVLFASCSSTKKTQTSPGSISTSSSISTVRPEERDGSNYEKAIVIKEKTESKGIAAEYKWLQANYPGYKLIRQSLNSQGKNHYDIMDIETKGGERKSIYFDITNFFGKW